MVLDYNGIFLTPCRQLYKVRWHFCVFILRSGKSPANCISIGGVPDWVSFYETEVRTSHMSCRHAPGAILVFRPSAARIQWNSCAVCPRPRRRVLHVGRVHGRREPRVPSFHSRQRCRGKVLECCRCQICCRCDPSSRSLSLHATEPRAGS